MSKEQLQLKSALVFKDEDQETAGAKNQIDLKIEKLVPETTESKENILTTEFGIVGTRETFKDVEFPAIRDEKSLRMKEFKYVPLELAKEKVEAAAADLARVKAEHIRLVHELERCHREIHDDTKNYYKSFLEKLRDKAVASVKQYKVLLKNAEYSLAQYQEESKKKEEALEEHMADILTENQERIHELNEKFNSEKKALETERANLIKEQLHEIERREKSFQAKFSSKEDQWKMKLKEQNEVVMMLREDYASQVLRLGENREEASMGLIPLGDDESPSTLEKTTSDMSSAALQKSKLQDELEKLIVERERERKELENLRKLVKESALSQNNVDSVPSVPQSTGEEDKGPLGAVEEKQRMSGEMAITDVATSTAATLAESETGIEVEEQKEAKTEHVEDLESKEDTTLSLSQESKEEQPPLLQESQQKVDQDGNPNESNHSIIPTDVLNKQGNTKLEGAQQQELEEVSKSMEKLKAELERERLKVQQKEAHIRKSGSALAATRNESRILREKVKELQELTKTKVSEVTRLSGEIADLTKKLGEAEKKSKEAKSEVRSWVAAFQKEHKRAPQKEDMQKVKPKYVAVKEADDAIKSLKRAIQETQQKHSQTMSGMVSLQSVISIPEEGDTLSVDGIQEQIGERQVSQVGQVQSNDFLESQNMSLAIDERTQQLEAQLTKLKLDQAGSKEVFELRQRVKDSDKRSQQLEAQLNKLKAGQANSDEVLKLRERLQYSDGRAQQLESELEKSKLDCKLLEAKQSTGDSETENKQDPQIAILEHEIERLRGQIAQNVKELSSQEQLAEKTSSSTNELETRLAEKDEMIMALRNEVQLSRNAQNTSRTNGSETSFEDNLSTTEPEGAQSTEASNVAQSNDPDVEEKKGRVNNKALKEAQEKIKENEKSKKELEAKVKSLQADMKAMGKGGDSSAATKRFMEKAKAAEKKLKESEGKVREMKTKINRLEKDLEKAKTASSVGGLNSSGDAVKLKKELENIKKRMEKALEEAEKTANKELKLSMERANAAEKSLFELEEKHDAIVAEMKTLKTKVKEVDALKAQVEELEEKTAELQKVKEELKEHQEEFKKVDALYKEEQALRKKYYNMMEDMKGKIRVYARCRPFANYEIENGSKQAVKFPDECTVVVEGSRGEKTFVYDQCFSPSSTQDEIFADTKNLIQSSFDGFNVCVFAYGQTGSGKTFTMVGTPEMPGLVRRTISEIFIHREKNKAKASLKVRVFMMELYLDNVVDLLFKVKNKGTRKAPPKLDIKKDKNGIVFVKGCEEEVVESAEELLRVFEAANAVRKVATTQMNSASSRSHLIFSVLLENTDLATKKTTIGKLSLVDLAGSERQEKTGATGDQLKEAMSINKSLAALGDVISALSSGEKFIPYRNNKLTQLMSDSLGGNAKTLMFVNISPADYNAEETLSSLVYASRVKLITNSADKKSESEEVTLLRKAIEELKASGATSKTLEELES